MWLYKRSVLSQRQGSLRDSCTPWLLDLPRYKPMLLHLVKMPRGVVESYQTPRATPMGSGLDLVAHARYKPRHKADPADTGGKSDLPRASGKYCRERELRSDLQGGLEVSSCAFPCRRMLPDSRCCGHISCRLWGRVGIRLGLSNDNLTTPRAQAIAGGLDRGENQAWSARERGEIALQPRGFCRVARTSETHQIEVYEHCAAVVRSYDSR